MKLTDNLQALKPFEVSKHEAVLLPAAMLLIALVAYGTLFDEEWVS